MRKNIAFNNRLSNRPGRHLFTQNTSQPQNHLSRLNNNIANTAVATPTFSLLFSRLNNNIANTIISTSTPSCAKNGIRNSCRCCNKIKTSPATSVVPNIVDDSYTGVVPNIVDDSYTSVGSPTCATGSKLCNGKDANGKDASGCTLISNPNVCCTDGRDGSGCTDANLICGLIPDVSLCGRIIQDCSGKPPSSAWEPAYFFSGGGANNSSSYTQITTATQTPTTNPKRTGADPSCGGNDFATLSTCILKTPLNANRVPATVGVFPPDPTRTPYEYPVQKLQWGKTAVELLMKHNNVSSPSSSDNKLMCKNCPNPGVDCNTHVQLINPDNEGKVPVLAHGVFGVPLSAAGCTSDVYDAGITKNQYFERVQKLSALLSNGDYPAKPDSYITYYKANNNNWVCIITKKAFDDAGLSHIYPVEANNGGVGLAWGHGVKNGSCGSASFLKQGEFNFGTDNSSTKNNVVLLIQIGMRAWSGEWNDTIGTQSPPFNENNKFDYTLNGSVQSYITEKLPYNSGSTTCLQPLMVDIDSNAGGDLDKLLATICPTLKNNEYNHPPCNIPQQNGTCTCDPSTKNACQPAVCKDADNKSIELCKSLAPWGCGTWTDG